MTPELIASMECLEAAIVLAALFLPWSLATTVHLWRGR